MRHNAASPSYTPPIRLFHFSPAVSSVRSLRCRVRRWYVEVYEERGIFWFLEKLNVGAFPKPSPRRYSAHAESRCFSKNEDPVPTPAPSRAMCMRGSGHRRPHVSAWLRRAIVRSHAHGNRSHGHGHVQALGLCTHARNLRHTHKRGKASKCFEDIDKSDYIYFLDISWIYLRFKKWFRFFP